MAAFDLDKSFESAALRFAAEPPRKRRSDAGGSRLDRRVESALNRLLRGQNRPAVAVLLEDLRRTCAHLRLRPPSRATIYNAIKRVPPHVYTVGALPGHVQAALYNLDLGGSVPGHQLAFYCFQYGDTRAMSFAAGLPWLDLLQADKLRGWRPRSHGLLRAVLTQRGIL